jgi:hypothetical protein
LITYFWHSLVKTIKYNTKRSRVSIKITLFSHRIQTEQANEIARLIRQYITIDQKSRDANGNQEGVSSRQAFVQSNFFGLLTQTNPITINNKYMI